MLLSYMRKGSLSVGQRATADDTTALGRRPDSGPQAAEKFSTWRAAAIDLFVNHAAPPRCKTWHLQDPCLYGAGGIGEEYVAYDPKLNRQVVLEVLPDTFNRDSSRMTPLQREAQLLAALHHPGIAAVYGLKTVKAVRFLVLEQVEGPTLAARIASGAIPLKETLNIARPIGASSSQPYHAS